MLNGIGRGACMLIGATKGWARHQRVVLRLAQSVSFGLRQGVQRLLYAPSHHRSRWTARRHPDDIAQRTRCSLDHGRSLPADPVAFNHLQFSQIRGRQPYLNVRKTLYSSTLDRLQGARFKAIGA